MAAKRKVTQIAMGGEGNAELYVLCDDGTLWKRVKSGGGWSWMAVTLDIPQP